MSQTTPKARGFMPLADSESSFRQIILRLVGLAILDAFGFWFLYQLIYDRAWPFVAVVAFVTLGLNVVFLIPRLYPLRWLSPGLALLILMALYPILFTVYTAFTNYSDGHLLTKQQTINLLAKQQYLPEGAGAYSWTAFRSPEGNFALWLISGSGESFLALPGKIETVTPGEGIVGPLDEQGIPQSIEGYQRLNRIEVIRYLTELGNIEFGEPPHTIKIRNLDVAAQFQQRYVYDASQDAIIDKETNTAYFGNAKTGLFTSKDGKSLTPGYQVTIGFTNFERLLDSPALRGPFVRVFIWTLAFAFLSVVTTFALGLFFALVYNDPEIRTRKLIRSLLIIPYAIPGVIGILVWRGMLNPNYGIVTTMMQNLIGWAPPWLSNQWWAKIAILLVNLWLGYPYMMLIASGALQAIPDDLYEAARVDGANNLQRFWNITLPLLLISVGPLLIASFSYNFNNFNVIYLFNEGGPPIPGTPTPAGHTDILISYAYRLAFAGHRGADYGYAAAISFVIFILVSLITLFNFRYTRMWEEISESV